jgi:hypothetical protein
LNIFNDQRKSPCWSVVYIYGSNQTMIVSVAVRPNIKVIIFLLNRMTHISIMNNKNGYLPDYHYFDINFPFFPRILIFSPNRPRCFLYRQSPIGASRRWRLANKIGCSIRSRRPNLQCRTSVTWGRLMERLADNRWSPSLWPQISDRDRKSNRLPSAVAAVRRTLHCQSEEQGQTRRVHRKTDRSDNIQPSTKRFTHISSDQPSQSSGYEADSSFTFTRSTF